MKYAWILLVVGCTKPQPAANVENAAAVAQYTGLLEECRQKGKEANSYAVYSQCADTVDAHLCQAHGLRCPEGGK